MSRARGKLMGSKVCHYSCYKDYPDIIDLHIAICSYGTLEQIREAEAIMDKYMSTIGMSFNYKPVSEMVVEELEEIWFNICFDKVRRVR